MDFVFGDSAKCQTMGARASVPSGRRRLASRRSDDTRDPRGTVASGFRQGVGVCAVCKRYPDEGARIPLGEIVSFHTASLVFALLGSAAVVTGAEPFAITKATAPLFYGLLGFSVYYLGRRGLQWDAKSSLPLVLVTTLYFVPLRFSWDMYKNLLGLAFFFLAILHLRGPRTGPPPRPMGPHGPQCGNRPR